MDSGSLDIPLHEIVYKRWIHKPDCKPLETINSRDSLLEEFDEEIFNALVEKIEILTPTHFVFELKSRMRVEEIEDRV